MQPVATQSLAMAGDSFEDHWPRYPSDGSSHKVMDVIAECDVDKLFKLQWDSSSEFLVSRLKILIHRQTGSRNSWPSATFPDEICNTF